MVYPGDDHSAAVDATAADIEGALLEAREGNAGPHRQAAYERVVAERAGSTSANPSDRLQAIRQKFTASGLRKNSYQLQCLGKIITVTLNSQPGYHHAPYFSGLFED